jgi:DNA polymerase II large subunit
MRFEYPPCSPTLRNYFDLLAGELDKAYGTASKARKQGLDPENQVEIPLAADVASRVEVLVGPKGIATRIRELISEGKGRDEIAFYLCREILENKYRTIAAAEGAATAASVSLDDAAKLIEQSVRTGLAVYTEGVVSAPLEGVSKVAIKRNQDGSAYAAVYFAGPIRGAGGTGQAFPLILADLCRNILGLGNWRPTNEEVDRYVEESNLYAIRTRVGQYPITEEEVRHIVRSCPVGVEGEPTEEYEVSVHKNTPGIETNRVRGGVCLVMSEGLCLKAAKLMKIAKKAGLDWQWIEALIRVAKKSEERVEIKPVSTYMEELVAGRPIFSYPMRSGGFRLRYGRTRFMGILAKGLNPATMAILDDFPVAGTQLKTERPAKGCIVMPCENIEGPVVRLKSGEVLRVDSHEEALKLRSEVEEVLYNGDLLANYGDFLRSNHPLVPSPWCEEWLAAELKAKGAAKSIAQLRALGFDEARKLAKETSTPIAPKFTFYWREISMDETKELADWLAKQSKLEYNWFELKALKLAYDSEKKRLLEILAVPHKLEAKGAAKNIVIERDNALALLTTLGLLDGKRVSSEKFDKAFQRHAHLEKKNVFELLGELAGLEVRDRSGVWLGASMGRPEKARERKMKPPVHVLFPIALHGGKTRNIMNAIEDKIDSSRGHGQGRASGAAGAEKSDSLELDLAYRICTNCKRLTWRNSCEKCGAHTLLARRCENCGALSAASDEKPQPQPAAAGEPAGESGAEAEAAAAGSFKNSFEDVKVYGTCKCGGRTSTHAEQTLNIANAIANAQTKLAGFSSYSQGASRVKGVMGLISAHRVPEPVEKGILRAAHDVTVFRDGTGRFDATEIPITHFVPREIGVSVEKLRAMGYEKDADGKPLASEDQIVEIFPQDVIFAHEAADYFMKLTAFVDDLLVYHYKIPAYYNMKKKEDLVGQLVIALAPHTSAGVLTRIIGFSEVRGFLAHPYLHCACRRNADGDELCAILLMDALLNFSRSYLPASRGGRMDAPLVLTAVLNPLEVDDEVYNMDTAREYPLEFYQAAQRYANPAEVKIETIASRLGKPAQYEGIGYTHEAKVAGPTTTKYVELSNMEEKVEVELALMQRLRAVQAADACERIILAHFFPDLYGNLHSWSKQSFRCVDCNRKYRRVPLVGKCTHCGGKLLLTIARGSVEKYLKISKDLIEKYGLPLYLKQRIMLLEKELSSLFEDEKVKQFSLSDYL